MTLSCAANGVWIHEFLQVLQGHVVSWTSFSCFGQVRREIHAPHATFITTFRRLVLTLYLGNETKMQPFKPPTLVGRAIGTASQPSAGPEPPLKKRRVSPASEHDDFEVVAAAAKVLQKDKPKAPRAFQSPHLARKPLQNVSNPAVAAQGQPQQGRGTDSYYTVLWCESCQTRFMQR